MSRRLPLAAALLACLGLLAAPAASRAADGTSAADDSLYQALGGLKGIEELMEGLLVEVAEDPRIVDLFRQSNIDRLHAKLVLQVCELSGGPCRYDGEPMGPVHAGLNLTEAHFNALVEDLQKAMDKRQLPVRVQNRLLKKLAALHGEVMARPARPADPASPRGQ